MPTSGTSVLLVEDDDRISRWLSVALGGVPYDVDVRSTLEQAREALGHGYDLILLDLGLPDGDGLELCRSIRAGDDAVPIIVLTSRAAVHERVLGLEAGADDYLTKPFHIPELVARIRAVLRRSRPQEAAPSLGLGDLRVDPVRRTATLDGVDLDLRRREFDLLAFFLANPGRPWTRAQLLDRVWGRDFAGEERTVDLHVARLRSKIEEEPSRPRLIQTEWGVGYRMPECG